MEINVMDYVSQQDIKDACLYEIRNMVRESLRGLTVSDILSNISYQCVFKEVDDILNISEEDRRKQINDKVVEIIEEMSSYNVFRRKQSYERDDSLAQKYLNEAVADNKELIQNRVKELMVEFNSRYFKEDLQDHIYEAINNKLFGEEK